ncbi:MAG: hypothetical protein ACI37T_01970 [Candidatus Gastranaerophilaceae bacterium]
MIWIWKCVKVSQNGKDKEDEVLISVQDTMENARYFCEKTALKT